MSTLGFTFARGGGTTTVAVDHIFEDVAARDAYFPSNLDELIQGTPILVGISGAVHLQIWDGTTNPPTYDNTLWNDLGAITLTPSDAAALASLKAIAEDRIAVGEGTNVKSADLQTDPIYLGVQDADNSWRLNQNGLLLEFQRYSTATSQYETIGTFGASLTTDRIRLLNAPRAVMFAVDPSNDETWNMIRVTTGNENSESSRRGIDVGSIEGNTFLTTREEIIEARLIDDSVSIQIRTLTDQTLPNVTTHTIPHTTPLVIDGVPKDAGVTTSIFVNIQTAGVRFNLTVTNRNSNEQIYTAFTPEQFNSGQGYTSVSGYQEYPLNPPFSLASGSEINVTFTFASPVTLVGGDYSGNFYANWGASGASIDFYRSMPVRRWISGATYTDGVGTNDNRSWIFAEDRIWQLRTGESGVQTGTFDSNRSRWQIVGEHPVFRGDFSTTAEYLRGDIVRSTYNLTNNAYFISEADQLPSTTLPENQLDTGQWVLLTDRTWRGAWSANRYVFGQVVSHNSNYWMAAANIAPTDTNPPSETNSSWIQINNGGSMGGGEAPNTIYMRTASRILDSSTKDNTFVSVETTGAALATVTFPDAGGSFLNRRITVSNNRTNGLVRIVMAANNTIYTAFNNTQLDLRVGESATLFAVDDNLWDLVHEADVSPTPNFPFNPQNDDNTFFFAVNGDTPTTWTRDQNTTINLRSDNGNVTYELANPSTSGITVNNDEGYIFQHTTGGNQAQIFPFSSTNRFFVDNVEYTSSNPFSIPLNNSLIVIYSSANNRWEGRAFNFLVQPQGAGGSSGGSGNQEADTRVITGVNEDTADLEKGDGVFVEGKGGNLGFVKSGLADTLNGFLIEDTTQNSMGQVVRFGAVTSQRIYDGNLFLGAPIAVDTELFWNNTDERVQLDSDSGAYTSVGNVLSSSFVFPTENHTVTQIIDTQAEWDDWHSKTHVKNVNTGGVEFQIPDLMEGSSEVTAIAGQSFIVHIPFGNGTTVIRPRGASTIIQGGTTYTNATPLPLTGGATAEYVFIQVNANADSYTAEPINQKGINTSFLFDWTTYLNKGLAGALQGAMVNIQTNTNAIASIERPLFTDIGDSDYSTVGTNAKLNHIYRFGGQTTTRTFTIANYTDWGLSAQRSQWFEVYNTSEQYLKIVNAAGNFFGMAGDTFYLKPQERRRFLITNNGGTYSIDPQGAIEYDFVFEKGLLTGGTWTNENGLLSDIIEPDGTNTERLVFKLDGDILNVVSTIHWAFTGTTPDDFEDDVASLTPSLNINKNGISEFSGHDAFLLNVTGAKTNYTLIGKDIDMVANDYLEFTGTDLTDIIGSTVLFKGRFVIKGA